MSPPSALAPMQQALSAVQLQAAALWPGWTAQVLPSVESTNAALLQQVRQGVVQPQMLVALEQTAGRGRQGKRWHSQAGASLTLSLALPMQPAQWAGLSLAVGVSVAEALGEQVQLKWPNDLWWQQRKLAGILVETTGSSTQRVAVIGLGINVRNPARWLAAAEQADALAQPAAGLEQLSGHTHTTAEQCLQQVLPTLLRDLRDFERNGFAAFEARFAQRDALRGRPVRLSDGQEGEACGVRADGALCLQTANGLQAVLQQEVSVRPC